VRAWLGAEGLPLTVREGEPAVKAMVLATDSGEVTLAAG
jgi:hypothetical protein